MKLRLPLLCALLLLAVAAPAAAMVELPENPVPIAGNPQALARRMGVEELIWDCGYWRAGMTQFTEYRPCYGKRGKLKRKVNATIAHRDHVHIGMTRRGAAARTSFWSRGR